MVAAEGTKVRLALGVEYDGSRFAGWEIQRAQRTVQAVLEHALSVVADHPVATVCAGRTDAGVHAWGQVVHMDTGARRPPHAWVLGTNANLPPDVNVTWAKEVGPDFSARFTARTRTYRYLIYNRSARSALLHGRVCLEHRALSLEPMQAAAGYLLGSHDFSTFRAAACQARSPVRTVHRLVVSREGPMVAIEVTANAFLHHMVRNIAGALMAVGTGRRPPGWVRQVLERRDRTQGGVTAPAAGLYLLRVRYPASCGVPAVFPPALLW